MFKKKKSVLSKVLSTLIVFTIALQLTANYSEIALAQVEDPVTTQDIQAGINVGDTINVAIDGVENVSNAEISLGDINPLIYEGYTFMNATVDDTVINSVGKYNGDYYYSTSEVDSAYLLGSNKVVLHYQKNVKTFNISYLYQSDIVNVVGKQSGNEGENVLFRLEMLNNSYQVNSVSMDGTELSIDSNGYYIIPSMKSDVSISIVTEIITNYKINVDSRYVGEFNLNLTKEVSKGNPEWTHIGTSNKLFNKTLNSIVVNDQYLNVTTNKTEETTLKDGATISVVSKRAWNFGKANYDYWYEIYVKNANNDLNFVPSMYTDPNISFLEIEGAVVYHWTGSVLETIPKGAMLPKNNSTDVFFVKTAAGYEASVSIKGSGFKIIEKINNVNDISKIPGGYQGAKEAALAQGCDYVFYYSDKSVSNRQVSISSSLIEYTVNYNLNDGQSDTLIEDSNNYSILANNNIVSVSDIVPTKKAHTFTGWKLVGTNKVYNAGDEVVIDSALFKSLTSNTLMFEAQWIRNQDVKTSSYTIKYFLEQENGKYTENEQLRTTIGNAPVNKTAIIIPKNDIANYIFDDSLKENILSGTVLANGSLELKAYYAKNADNWTKVTFLSGENGLLNADQESIVSKDVLIGGTFDSQLISIPEITANKGWLISKQPWDIEISGETLITKNLVIKAQYDEDRNEDKIADKEQYVKVTFNAGDFGNYNGKNSIVLEELLPGDIISIPSLSVNSAYTFIGYDNEVVLEVGDTSAKEVVYTAQYTLIPVEPVLPVTPISPLTPTPLALTPGAVAIPAVLTPTPGPAAENVTIDENETPKAKGETKINENKTPLANANDQWSLFNLLITFAIIAFAAFIILLKNKNERNEDDSKTFKFILKAMSGIFSIVAIAIFVLTQDISSTMAIFDQWSILMTTLLLAQFIVMVLVKNVNKFQRDSVQKA